MKYSFEWDDNKRLTVLTKHGIDFVDAIKIFTLNPVLHVPSAYTDEARWLTIGELNGQSIMIVWTYRGPVIRIITARRLGEDEKSKYYENDLARSEKPPRED